MPSPSKRWSRSLRTYFRLQLFELEDRSTPASLFLDPDVSAEFAVVGNSFSQSYRAYGPDPASRGPYQYSPGSASIPGLSFATNGDAFTLSGIPTTAGNYTFTVSTTDEIGNSGQRQYDLRVEAPAVPGISLYRLSGSPTIDGGTAGYAYTQILFAAGGNGNYSFTTPQELNGLTFFAYRNTITISGTPERAGTFPFSISTRDTAGNTGVQSFTLDIGLGLVPGGDLAPGLVGRAYGQTLSALGGTGATSIVATGLPAWLSATRVGNSLQLAGVPTAAGSYPFTAVATDGDGRTATVHYAVNIAATDVSLLIETPGNGPNTTNVLANGRVGDAYHQDLVAQGGSGSYTLMFPDTDANGLNVTASANAIHIDGTPTHAGTFGYLLVATDEFGLSSPVRQYWITIGDAPSPTDLILVPGDAAPGLAGPVGSYFSRSFSAFGGNVTYAFSLGSGSTVPPGLSFAQYGRDFVLAGTPTAAGSFEVTVVVDSNGQSIQSTYKIEISALGTLTLTRQLIQPSNQNEIYDQALVSNAESAAGPSNAIQNLPFVLTASGGSGRGYTFTATGLPPGMTLSSTGVLNGYPAVSGDFEVAVTVVDDVGNSASKTYDLPIVPSLPTVGFNAGGAPIPETPNIFTGTANRVDAVRKAYGFDKIVLPGGIVGDGRGQTIAVIEASDNSRFVSSIPGLTSNRPDQSSYANSDFAAFNEFYGLPQFASAPGGEAPVFVKLDATGGVNYPISGNGNGEFAEDVQTIHALAPMANIVVIVAPPNVGDDFLSTLYPLMMSLPNNWPSLPPSTRALLAGLPPVSVVSSSVYFSYNEYPGEVDQESRYLPPDPNLQPATVVIAAGDTGYFVPTLTGPEYPGNSANVLSAAMTQPSIGVDGTYYGEVGVSNAGGGPSLYLPQPAWQNGVVDRYSTTNRVGPDVGMVGSFNSGMTNFIGGEWNQANGSSNAAPAWAALIAIMNQGRALLGQKPFNGTTETLPMLYGLPASDWNKISQLDDGTDVPGNFNMAAGLGSPIANLLVADMLGGKNPISGTVRNAVTGAGTSKLSVYLDANGNSKFDAGEAYTQTDADGGYEFIASPGANYRPRLDVPAGTFQVSANPAPIQFPIGSATSTGNDFVIVDTLLPTTTGLTLSTSVLPVGRSLSLIAAVSSSFATVTGTVTFFDGNVTLGTATLENGIATLVVSTLAAGPHSLSAKYLAAGPFGASASSTVPFSATAPGLVGVPAFAVGADAGGGPAVRTFDNLGTLLTSQTVFDGSFRGGVRVAVADFNGDGFLDTATGTGPGVASRVVVIDGRTGAQQIALLPFGEFSGGAFLAASDIDGDGRAELAITPDVGGGPRVLVLDGDGFGILADFFGIDDPNFRGGVRASFGDVNGDGRADLVVAAGAGGGPRVAIFDGASLDFGLVPSRLIPDFFAFEPALRDGANVAVGDVNGDGLADLFLAAGGGGSPRVRIADAATILKLGDVGDLDDNLEAVVADFYAGDSSARSGVRVVVKDLDGDQFADLVAGAGTGDVVQSYLGKNLKVAETSTTAFEFAAFDGFSGGVFVG